MEIFIKDLKMCECDICVSVGDLENSNATATVTIEYPHDGKTIELSKEVRLGFPPQIIRFPKIHKNGKNTSVTATVKSGTYNKSTLTILKFCNQLTNSTEN